MADQIGVTILLEVTEIDVFTSQLASLDNQSLDSTEFEVLLSVRGLDNGALRQIQQVSEYRPNLRLTSTERGETLLAECRGTFVLDLRAADTLFPSALEWMRDFADQHGCDIVQGRVVEGAEPVAEDLWSDRPVATDHASPARDRALLVRRSVAEFSPESRDLVARSGRSGVQATYPCVLRGSTSDGTIPAPGAKATSATWSGDRLLLSLTGPAAEGERGAHGVLRLRHTTTMDLRLAPVRIDSTTTDNENPNDEESTWAAEAVVVPLSVCDTTSKAGLGVWTLELQVDSANGSHPRVLPVEWTPCAAAVICGVPVVPAPVKNVFALDIGSLAYPLTPAVDPALASVTESAAGSLMTIILPDLHVHDTEELEGLIALDKLQLPARLVAATNGAQIEALVSGTSGLAAVSAQFGAGRLQPLGVSLRIDGVGFMQVVDTPAPVKPAQRSPSAPASKPPPTPKARAAEVKPKPKQKPKSKPKPQPRRGTMAKLRRAVPAPLEPVVRRLARVPLAQRLYRRVTH